MKFVALLLLIACAPRSRPGEARCEPGATIHEDGGRVRVAIERCAPAVLMATRDGVALPPIAFTGFGVDLPLESLGDYEIAIEHRAERIAGPWRVRVESVPLFGGGRRREVHVDLGAHATATGLGVSRWISDDGHDAAWRVEWYRDGALAFSDHGRDRTLLPGLLVGSPTINTDRSWWAFDRERYPDHSNVRGEWEVRIFRENAPAIGVQSSAWNAPYALPPALTGDRIAALATEPALPLLDWYRPLCGAFPDELRALQRSSGAVARRLLIVQEPWPSRDGEPSVDWVRVDPKRRERTMASCERLGKLVAELSQGEEPAPSFR